MRNKLIEGFEVIQRTSTEPRMVKCGLCKETVNGSIIPHMKSLHQDDWQKWKDRFIELRKNKASFKDIMWDFDRMFSWTVIKSEIRLEDPLLMKTTKIKTIEPNEKFEVQTTTLWKFATRGTWANHNQHYAGNFAPQVARNLILKYSDEKDYIADCFVGGGTSLIESYLLGRNAIGIDVSPVAIAATQKRLEELKRASKKLINPLPNVTIVARRGDARNMDFIPDSSIDLTIAHPPYLDAISYTKTVYDDLSRISDLTQFLIEMRKVAKEIYRILKHDKFCAIVIGDVRRDSLVIPVGIEIYSVFKLTGFKPVEVIIKEQPRPSTQEFYHSNAAKNGHLQIAHEYIHVFSK